jgi:polysaccharide deacetylase 2 family uncharacterized protein YibQ
VKLIYLNNATHPYLRGVVVPLGLLLTFLFPVAYADIDVLPRLAVIIDDLGNNAVLDQRALRLVGPITASILPLTPYAAEDANMAKAKGLLIIAHLPMQADNGKALGLGGLTEQMGEVELKKQLTQDLDSIPGINGVSNHMGSRLTRNRQAMQWVMEGLKGRSLFYLDSRTCPGSVAADSARRAGIPTLERDVFLDHDRNTADIEKQFDRMLQIARRKGSAIAIGHPFPETLAILERRLPQLANQGFRLVRLDELLPTRIKR